LHDAVVSEITQAGNNIGLMKCLGTSPRAFGERIIRWAQENSRLDPGARRYIKNARLVLNTVLGDYDRPMSGLAGKLFNANRMIQYATKLGSVLLSSIPDVGLMVSALREHGVRASDVYFKTINDFIKGIPKGEMKNLALQLRIYSDSQLGDAIAKFGNVDSFGGKFNKFLNLQMRLFGLERYDKTGRFTMGSILSNNLARVSDQKFSSLIEGEQKALSVSGIDEKAWEVIRTNKKAQVNIQNKRFITPEIVDDFSKESIEKVYFEGKETDIRKINRVKKDIKDALGIYFTDQTGYGKVFPNEADRALIIQGVRGDTFAGQIWRMIMMFKSFGVAMTRRTAGRFIYGKGAETLS
jgi:hypothetical protein